jgi:hypothetical protein
MRAVRFLLQSVRRQFAIAAKSRDLKPVSIQIGADTTRAYSRRRVWLQGAIRERQRYQSGGVEWRRADRLHFDGAAFVSFRGFADYMQTPEFAENLAGLIEEATRERIA